MGKREEGRGKREEGRRDVHLHNKLRPCISSESGDDNCDCQIHQKLKQPTESIRTNAAGAAGAASFV